MGSGAMIYTTSVIKITLAVQKLIGEGGYTDTQTALLSYNPTFIFLKNKESRLKIHHPITW
jgi:hypothetical protein